MLTEVLRDWPSTQSPTIDRDHIIAAYQKYLRREPDESGLAFWLEQAGNRMTADDLDQAFILCQEFQDLTEKDQISSLQDLANFETATYPLSRIGTVAAALSIPAFRSNVQRGTFELPSGFDLSLNPLSKEYHEQQLKLWSAITRRTAYNPAFDEDTPEIAHADALYRPSFYAVGDSFLAGEHLMALGHILRHSGLKSGDRALEYGAGFGQIALAFARCGVQVDTVDINKSFSAVVNRIGDHYNAPLNAHVGHFGDNPAGHDSSYDLIYFYESFHHCFEFKEVIPKLFKMLKPGGKVFMAGEPISKGPSSWMPYPWGIRLDGENVSIMRQRGWMELGFQEDFLVSIFENNGFVFKKHPLDQFHYCTIYAFERPLSA